MTREKQARAQQSGGAQDSVRELAEAVPARVMAQLEREGVKDHSPLVHPAVTHPDQTGE